MRRQCLQDKKFSEMTGKLHMSCPHSEKSGIRIHVVIRDGVCYKSGICMVVECKHNCFQGDLTRLLSVTW